MTDTNLEALCEARDIEIITGRGGVEKIPALVRGDLAVHRRLTRGWSGKPDYGRDWSITHLPTGMSLMSAFCLFRSRRQAIEAMLEIARLKNSWALLEPEEMAELGRQTAEIGKRHGGRRPSNPGHYVRVENAPRLNGYEETAD